MGKKAIKHYFNTLMLGVTVILFIFTFIGLFGGDVTPVGHNVRALSTMVLPAFFILDIVALIYWGIRRSWFVFLPVLPIVCTLKYTGTIFQFGGKPDNVQQNVTICSYNVRGFNNDGTGNVFKSVMNSMEKEGADIICLQEFNNTLSGEQRTITEFMKERFPYSALAKDMVILSKVSIMQSGDTLFPDSNNGAMWADVQIDAQHRVRIYNVHMETTGINSTLHQAAKQGEIPTDSAGIDNIPINMHVAGNIFERFMQSAEQRSGQTNMVANLINIEKAKHGAKALPTILCGDFNDVPYSYTYNTLLGEMKDGFREGGHGYGATYRGAKGLFRIDYIFHDAGMESLDYYTVDQDYSDHNPVYSKIAFRSTAK